MTEIPDTYEDLAWKLVKMLPLGYSRIDIVCNTYQENLSSHMRETSAVFQVKLLFNHINPKYQEILRDFSKMGITKQG